MKWLFPFFILCAPFTAHTESITIHNRPLITLQEETISLLDVTKKMNLLIYNHSKDLLNSPKELYEFYSSNWIFSLKELIEEKLIYLHATEKGIKVPKTEIIKEVKKRFGSLEGIPLLKLSSEDIQAMVEKDLIVQEMLRFEVYRKVFYAITPEKIQNRYKNTILKNFPKESWNYFLVSAEGENSLVSLEEAKRLLIEGASIDTLKEKCPSLKISSPYTMSSSKISSSYKKILSSLQKKGTSSPLPHKKGHRLFYLQDHIFIPAPKLPKVSDKIREELFQEETANEKQTYIQSLKEKFHLDEKEMLSKVPRDYIPFTLQ